MRAFVLDSPGQQPILAELDAPRPQPGEVRVRVSAASVNGFDFAVAAGAMANFFEYRYPVVLGREFSGVVDEVGDGVTDLAVGDRVLGVVSKPYLGEGAFAEYTTAAAADSVVRAPQSLSDPAAASLAHTGSTALIIVAALGDVTGRSVLVVGATGGVGTILVQLLAGEGAEVIATGRTDEGRALLRELGATAVVDYAALEDEVRSLAPDGVDAAVHLGGDAADISSLVKDGGALVSPVLYAPEMFPEPDRVAAVPVAGYPTGEGLRALTALMDSGSLRIIVDREHTLDEVATAFAAYGSHTIGNIVVRIGDGGA